MKNIILVLAIMLFGTFNLNAQSCVECHKEINPKIVSDWELSKHGQEGIECDVCHGMDHTGRNDVEKVNIPTPATCADCHSERVEEYRKGKHALAWTAMKALPTTHHLPNPLADGMKGCGSCHKIGEKTDEELKRLDKEGSGFGVGACNSCHTRHLFSKKEAQQPQACRTCHMGFDHPQWEMYSSSKHGVRNDLIQKGAIPELAAGPTCQTCHMNEGNHEVRTSWGFFAVRMPLPENERWKQDQVSILQALGVLDPEGKPTARYDLVKDLDLVRLDQESWQKERDKKLEICNQCHSGNFARTELEKGDKMIQYADSLMGEAIRTIAALYEDNILEKPKSYSYPFPDLLTFQDAPTVIEQRLFEMFMKHRMRTFQGAFHSNPDYAMWYGWSEMVRDITEIKEKAAEMRERKK